MRSRMSSRVRSVLFIAVCFLRFPEEWTNPFHHQMLFDIEAAYNEFFRSLSSGNEGGGT